MDSFLHVKFSGHSGKAILLEIDLPVRYLLDTSFLLSACIVAMLVYMLFYLWHFMVTGKKIKQLRMQYRDLISEVVIAESTEELETVLAASGLIQRSLRRRLGKKVFLEELLTIRKAVSGQAVENIQWLYQKLHLQADSLGRLTASKWHIKAAAIQELAQMGGKDCITRIYRFTNHKNFYVRTEAQVALVKMTGFKGLRFLNVVAHPLTQWQQVCLMQQLSVQADAEPEQVAGWLQSDNETVVELALKIVGAFKIYSLHDAVAGCLNHTSETVQQEAVRTLGEIEQETTSALLQNFHFSPLVLR